MGVGVGFITSTTFSGHLTSTISLMGVPRARSSAGAVALNDRKRPSSFQEKNARESRIQRAMDHDSHSYHWRCHIHVGGLAKSETQMKGETMDNIPLNTIANIVTAVCAVLIAIKVL